MSETLYAFLSIALATLFSLNQQRNTIATYQSLVQSEFEIMANGVALQKLEVLAGKDFESLMDHGGDSEVTTFTAGNVTIPFEVETSVSYVTVSGEASVSATDYIEVSVSVTQARFENPIVVHTRIFSS
jgi:hypothetical protein